MERSRYAMLLAACVLALWATGSVAATGSPTPAGGDGAPAPLARYALGEITEADLARVAGIAEARLEQALYDLRVRTIRQLVAERMLRMKALEQGKTRDELYAELVTSRVREPGDEEVARLLERYRDRLPKDEEEARRQAREALVRQEVDRLERSLQQRLLAEARLEILLEPPRWPVPVDEADPARGPADAPVTIVEFGDFECPYCARLATMLERLQRRHEGKVRVVFKLRPLESHAHAREAALAALCAAEQGRFWELHDLLYADGGKLDDDAIHRAVEDAGLDADAYAACRASDRPGTRLDALLAQAGQLDVRGTPVLYVNGILIAGMPDWGYLERTVRRELARAGTAHGGPAGGTRAEGSG